MRILITLSGLHRTSRGAEVALENIGHALAKLGEDVVLEGSGPPRTESAYDYRQITSLDRARFRHWPKVVPFRDDSSYESLLFNLRAARGRQLSSFDVTVTCGFPWDNLFLRCAPPTRRSRHVFITENGDWPARLRNADARLFGCDGLVCTNPVYLERNRRRWHSRLIPNGIDSELFCPGASERARLGLPDGRLVLMASALIESKRVSDGIRAVAALGDASLIVAGSGQLERECDELGRGLLGDRYLRMTFDHVDMPAVYRSTDVLLHLSRFESFGNVYLEALACGLPIIAHRSPITEWIIGSDGWLVDAENSSAVVAALGAALSSEPGVDIDRDRIRREFSWDAVALEYQSFLAEVAGLS